MVTNSHIAMQLAGERQRDLRAAGLQARGPRTFAGLVAALTRRGGAGDAIHSPASQAAPHVRAAEVRVPHASEARIRRSRVARGAARTAATRRHEPARESKRVGS